MERPWLILRRVLSVVPPPGDGDVHADAEEDPVVIDEAEADAQEQHAGVGQAEVHVHVADVDAAVEAQAQHDAVAEDEAEADAQAQEEHAAADAEDDEQEQAEEAAIQLEDSVVDVNTNQAVSQLAHLVLGPGDPDFTVMVQRPPRVSFLSAFPDSHPDRAKPDVYPYIVATGRFCLLLHSAIAPSYGTNFNQYPSHSNFVVVRHFLRGGAQIRACAMYVPAHPLGLSNIESVGLVCNQETGDYLIAELIVTTGAAEASVVYMSSNINIWLGSYNANPLLPEDRRRDWVPHGTAAINSTVLWFDLTWGIISCDLAQPPPLHQALNFHRLPPGRVLRAGAGVPDLHCSRCIAVSENLVRYVEIILHYHQAATVNMWYRQVEDNPHPRWQTNYSVSFEDIWADESYAQTGLPQTPPMLVGVSPVNSSVVYFSLNQRLFGVNVPDHTVVHCAQYEPLQRPGPRDEPVTSRYLITWNLDADAAPNVGHHPDEPSDHEDSSPSGPADEGEIDYEPPPE